MAKRRPIDDSVMRDRRALRLAKKDTLEWGTPVLYLRAVDERIFAAPVSPPLRSAPSPDPVPTPEVAASPRIPMRQEPPDPPAPPPVEPRTVPHPKVVHTLRHREAVTAVAFSPAGRLLATASAGKTVRIWGLSDDEYPWWACDFRHGAARRREHPGTWRPL